MFSHEVVSHLISDETMRWDSTILTQHSLSRRLRPYGIVSGTVRRRDKTLKGYKREQFEAAWAIWIDEDDA